MDPLMDPILYIYHLGTEAMRCFLGRYFNQEVADEALYMSLAGSLNSLIYDEEVSTADLLLSFFSDLCDHIDAGGITEYLPDVFSDKESEEGLEYWRGRFEEVMLTCYKVKEGKPLNSYDRKPVEELIDQVLQASESEEIY